MNYKEYMYEIEKACGYKYGLMNKKVYVTGMSFKKGYECTYHQYGVIVNTSNKCFGIKLDNYKNPASQKGLFWLEYDYFKIVDEEMEDFTMKKLNGYQKVAVIRQGYKDYFYAIYDDGSEYEIGDKVVVSGNITIQEIKEVISIDKAKLRYKGNITAEIITKLNTKAYDSRVEKRKQTEELKKEIDKIIKEMDEVNKYEMYAKQNPELKKLLDKFNELSV